MYFGVLIAYVRKRFRKGGKWWRKITPGVRTRGIVDRPNKNWVSGVDVP